VYLVLREHNKEGMLSPFPAPFAGDTGHGMYLRWLVVKRIEDNAFRIFKDGSHAVFTLGFEQLTRWVI